MATAVKNILITGASSGLGAALARHYAKQRHRLFISGRDSIRLYDVASFCEKLGAEVHVQVMDVQAEALMHQWITGIDKRYPVDLVIANAGISGGTSGLSEEDFARQSRHIFEINVTGVLNTTGPILPRMVTRKCGQIAIISSLSSFAAWPGAPAYSASKAAIRYYGEALRGRFAKRGIRISVICPGFIRTPLTDVNDFPMPFLMDADEAAEKIAAGLEKDRALICFPWPVSFVSRALGFLPLRLRSYLLARAPEKTPLQNF